MSSTVSAVTSQLGCQLSSATKPPALPELVPSVLPSAAHSASWVWDRMLSEDNTKKWTFASPSLEVHCSREAHSVSFPHQPMQVEQGTVPVSRKVQPTRTTSVLLLVDVGLEHKPP